MYLNLQTSTSTSASTLTAYRLHHSRCICIILDTSHDSRRASAEVSASNQVRSRPTLLVRPRGYWSIHQEVFVILVTTLTFLKTKLTSAQGRSPSCIQKDLYPHRHQRLLEADMLQASTSGWAAGKSTT